MTTETRDNLLRICDKRIKSGRITGNWKAVSEAELEKQRIWDEFVKESANGPAQRTRSANYSNEQK